MIIFHKKEQNPHNSTHSIDLQKLKLMKFTIDSKHREYYNLQGSVEFEALLDATQTGQLYSAICQTLAKRLKHPLEKVEHHPAELLFMQGYDLWREHPFIRKLVTSLHFSQIAADLEAKKSLRLGYTLYFPSPPLLVEAEPVLKSYQQLLQKHTSLISLSCLQGIESALMLCIKSPHELSPLPSSLFALKAGDGIYFKPTISFNFQDLLPRQGYAYLLIVYVKPMTVYTFQAHDPHGHYLKQWGYNYNDRLTDKLNPILLR